MIVIQILMQKSVVQEGKTNYPYYGGADALYDTGYDHQPVGGYLH